jgi:clathrin heavy chain
MLYACYDLIPLHKVMELSWRHNLSDFTMPFMINYMSQQASMIDTLRRDNEERKARETSTQKPEDDGPILGQSRLLLTQAPVQSSAPTTGGMYGGGMNGIMPQATGYSNMGGFR